MRLSKVAKELNVGIANIVDYLASKGVKVDGRPNTKITPDAYEILKQQFSADVEQHKRSTEVAQARREEKQAIKDAATKKIEKTSEVVKAKANVSGPKMVGKIEVPKAIKIESKDKSVNPISEPLDTDHKSEKVEDLEGKNVSQSTKVVADSNVKNDQFIRAKDTPSLSEPKHSGNIDLNKPINSDSVSKVESVEEKKHIVQNEQEKLTPY